MSELLGRRCLITGAPGGLGAAIAKRFWRAGADLLLVSRGEHALAQLARDLLPRSGQRVDIFAADLALPNAPARIVDEVARVGGLHVLVNCVGVQGPIGVAWENDWAEWEHALRVNLLSVVDLSRRAVPLLATERGGKIISISGGGAATPRARFTAYATAKAGVVRFSETLAQEVAEIGIDVNCVAPGARHTAMTEAVLAAGASRAGEQECLNAGRVAQGGATTVDRAADLCAFLASRASDGITGRLLAATWDAWETLPRHLDELRDSDVYTLRRVLPTDRGFDWDTGQ